MVKNIIMDNSQEEALPPLGTHYKKIKLFSKEAFDYCTLKYRFHLYDDSLSSQIPSPRPPSLYMWSSQCMLQELKVELRQIESVRRCSKFALADFEATFQGKTLPSSFRVRTPPTSRTRTASCRRAFSGPSPPPDGSTPIDLHLKKGATVILRGNVSQARGLCNVRRARRSLPHGVLRLSFQEHGILLLSPQHHLRA